MDEIRKYESKGGIIDALQRFDADLQAGKIREEDDLHGKELEALRQLLEMKGQANNTYEAILAAYRMGYMRRYDEEGGTL